jgi:hypothetical protein
MCLTSELVGQKKLLTQALVFRQVHCTHGNKLNHMKTQSLLLTAAAVCLGATSAFGAVSSNIVGYTKLSLVQGLNLIGNTLDNKNGNKIADVIPLAPDGANVYTFDGANFSVVQYFQNDTSNPAAGGVWSGDATLAPGTGFFIDVPSATSLTFVGEVLQGSLSNPIPSGLSIKSSQVPQAGALDALGLLAGDGDTVYYYQGSGYTGYQFFANDTTNPAAGGVWSTPDNAAPQLAVGQAVFYASGGAATWKRTFTVN